MALGGAVFTGNSKLFDGPLGVVKIAFAGYDLGKTSADTVLTPDQDIKDIIYQQDGTKPADHVRTGIEYMLNATFSEISTGLVKVLMSGVESANTSTVADSGTIGRNVYQSMLANEAGALKVAAVDAYGIPSENDDDIMFFYKAIPIVDGDLVNWGADSQRGLAVNFRIKFYTFPTPHTYAVDGAYGYWGDPTTENVLPVTWPDVEAPEIVSASVPLATSLEVIFDENIALQTGSFVAGSAGASVDGVLILATAGSVSTTTLTLTFPASSFAAGNVVELFITELCVEDTETSANAFGGVSDYLVSNPLV